MLFCQPVEPVKLAPMVWLPVASDDVLKVATPEVLTATLEARTVAPSVKVTLPTGEPPELVTVAVNVTLCPCDAGFEDGRERCRCRALHDGRYVARAGRVGRIARVRSSDRRGTRRQRGRREIREAVRKSQLRERRAPCVNVTWPVGAAPPVGTERP